jgi:hypothetical protein
MHNHTSKQLKCCLGMMAKDLLFLPYRMSNLGACLLVASKQPKNVVYKWWPRMPFPSTRLSNLGTHPSPTVLKGFGGKWTRNTAPTWNTTKSVITKNNLKTSSCGGNYQLFYLKEHRESVTEYSLFFQILFTKWQKICHQKTKKSEKQKYQKYFEFPFVVIKCFPVYFLAQFLALF